VIGGEVIDVEVVWLVLAGVSAIASLGGVIAFSTGMTRAQVLAPAGIWAFLGGMTVGLVSESVEQSLDGTVPWLADVLPVVGFIVAGLGLVRVGLSARTVEG
jgi:peptidoglycan/LPS O-acetylase OafA/YrhL